MKNSLLIGIIFLSIIAGTNTMNKSTNKEGTNKVPNIKLRNLSQGNSTLPKPLGTTNGRKSPKTDDALANANKKDALPRRFSNPEIEKK